MINLFSYSSVGQSVAARGTDENKLACWDGLGWGWVGLGQAAAEEDGLEPGSGWAGPGQSICVCKARTAKRGKSVRLCHFFARGTDENKLPGRAWPGPGRAGPGQGRRGRRGARAGLGWAGMGRDGPGHLFPRGTEKDT